MAWSHEKFMNGHGSGPTTWSLGNWHPATWKVTFPNGKDRLPTIQFQRRAVKRWGCTIHGCQLLTSWEHILQKSSLPIGFFLEIFGKGWNLGRWSKKTSIGTHKVFEQWKKGPWLCVVYRAGILLRSYVGDMGIIFHKPLDKNPD